MSRTPVDGPVDFGPWRRTAGIGGSRVIVNTRVALLIVAALGGGLVAFLLAVALGEFPVSLGEVLAIIGGADHGFANTVVLEWRLPRAVAGLVFGAALGVSGAIFQSITRNPLGSPDVIGLGVGAYTGALVAILLFGGGTAVTPFALVGGLGTAFVVYLLSYRRGLSGIRFVVVGIAVSSALTAVNTILMLRLSTRFATMVSIWGQGTLVDVRWAEVAPVGIVVILLLSVAALLSPALHQLELGDGAASATGVRIERTRVALIAVGVLLTAIVTSIAGPVAFVALVAPQVARLLGGASGVTLAGSAATGALLFSASDVIGAHLLPVPVPVGVVTGVLGGFYLLWLILREARR